MAPPQAADLRRAGLQLARRRLNGLPDCRADPPKTCPGRRPDQRNALTLPYHREPAAHRTGSYFRAAQDDNPAGQSRGRGSRHAQSMAAADIAAKDVVIPGVGLAPAPGVGAADLHRRGPARPAVPGRAHPPLGRRRGQGIPPARRERPVLPQLPRPARPPPHPDPQPGPLRQRPRGRSSAHRAPPSEQRQAFDLIGAPIPLTWKK